MPSKIDSIRLRGIKQNNLKNLDLDIPIGKLTVVTGLSGTGKSSLVFETLHAEGNRRYAETFSSYVRQFLERTDRPQVDLIENIRPSIAVEQGNTVKTSRSTVGTMTELCDYFKVWFAHQSKLHDPTTGKILKEIHPQQIWKECQTQLPKQLVLICFKLILPHSISWKEIQKQIQKQGYTRAWVKNAPRRIDELNASDLKTTKSLTVIQDRLKITPANEKRFKESTKTALRFGEGQIEIIANEQSISIPFHEGLRSSDGKTKFKPASPNLFSFNSPLGACPQCRGFGRIIEIDPNLVIPDQNLTIEEGVIRAFSGAVYSESQRDLISACRKASISLKTSWKNLSQKEKDFVYEGEQNYELKRSKGLKAWYGVRRFFNWLEENTYKMHVRVFLSRYRSYVKCPSCSGTRLQPESLLWKWNTHTLPDLYNLPIDQLEKIVSKSSLKASDKQLTLAHHTILKRLSYLNEVGLGYLTLNRSSRSLSGGETQRVNLTSCLGTNLVDTLFILDEPSVGLHCRDIDRLIKFLRKLTEQGNTVVVVEHDEAIMRAADEIIEIGPCPGSRGGEISFKGTFTQLKKSRKSITGDYLLGKKDVAFPKSRRSIHRSPKLYLKGIRKHNLDNISLKIPLQRFVVLTGVSGSGKSTLLNNAIYQGILASQGKSVNDPSEFSSIDSGIGFSDVLFIDQSPVSRTPRSTPVLFVDAWNSIRELFAQTDLSRSSGFTASHFSFNSGHGRCPHCEGLGFEKIEMQFMADVFVQCPICEGRRFKEEVLSVKWFGKTVDEVLNLSVTEALSFFEGRPKIISRLKPLEDLGLGYLPLGQPLNTLSGGESQRLKLVSHLGQIGKSANHSLILLDEPTTGLHRDDINKLVDVLHRLVENHHSLIVIEHHPDLIKQADWIIEMGPEAGDKGGKVVFEGTPESLTKTNESPTALFVEESMSGYASPLRANRSKQSQKKSSTTLRIQGAREHNLKNIDVSLNHNEITVVTGVSGSGKSTLAFDIVFAEGQRRFMESMSSWARQYVEQLPKPDIDSLTGIAPSVAIEQRVNRGTKKSTVSTITEVAQYLRLLFARAGIQHSPVTGEPLLSLDNKKLFDVLTRKIISTRGSLNLFVPLVKGRKGHHEPLAKWAIDHGYERLKIDGVLTDLTNFKRLDRYREHDIDLLFAQILTKNKTSKKIELVCRGEIMTLESVFHEMLRLGKGSLYLAKNTGERLSWFSNKRTDPTTGESYPDPEPKFFSWNSARGWCPTCHGHGKVYPWMINDEHYDFEDEVDEAGETCSNCEGTRLNHLARNVYLTLRNGDKINLPSLLNLPATQLLEKLNKLKLDPIGKRVFEEVFPEIKERLQFLSDVGLGYLSLDRATNTLSGGESQRIRLASQLGSNLSGVLYVLDEPSIGLHAQDNAQLIDSLKRLKEKGNTLLIVEHDLETMQAADRIIDLGPGAGKQGGEILEIGTISKLKQSKKSLTGTFLNQGLKHPQRGSYRKLPKKITNRSRKGFHQWLLLQEPKLRNLKGHDIFIPKGFLTVVCGISGSGKSTLIRDLLKPSIEKSIKSKQAFFKSDNDNFKSLKGANEFAKVIEVDQSPIGKTPRSIPATYIGIWDKIRSFFANLPDSKIHGYSPSIFSFNTKGGRCETCKGAGRIKLEMSFMPDAYVSCEDCGGTRFGSDILSIQWNGKNISEILNLSFEEAAEFLSFDSQLKAILDLMIETGLGYLTLGQSSPTLSGGEAQRLKLVSELAKGVQTMSKKQSSTKNFYILEEPTIGLHLSDCEKLTRLLHRLVDQGHTVVLIEHHIDLISEADYIIEMGPTGGKDGGEVLYQGSLEGMLTHERSITKRYIKRIH